MASDEASAAYLGGIGTMLEVADVCPSCGRVHTDRQYAFLHRGSGHCPSLIESNYAVVSRPVDLAQAHLIAASPTRGASSDIPVSMGSLPVPPKQAELERRPRHMGLPMLPPPEMGAIF